MVIFAEAAYVPWFFRDDDEWKTLAERLKHTPCPRCKAVGTLNWHGYLGGGDEAGTTKKSIRARRIFCSNRNLRQGCGKTFSVWLANKIRRLSFTTGTLWTFLQGAVASTIAAASRVVRRHRSDRTW